MKAKGRCANGYGERRVSKRIQRERERRVSKRIQREDGVQTDTERDHDLNDPSVYSTLIYSNLKLIVYRKG